MSKSLTKRALIVSLKQLMEERLFSKITVADICSNAEVSNRNFYRYYRDKYDLLDDIFDYEIMSHVEYHDDWCGWDYLPNFCDYCYKNRAFICNAALVGGPNSPRELWRTFLKPYILHDFQDTFSDEAAAEFYIPRLTDMIIDNVLLWLKNEPGLPPDKFIASLRSSLASNSRRVWELCSRKTHSPLDRTI